MGNQNQRSRGSEYGGYVSDGMGSSGGGGGGDGSGDGIQSRRQSKQSGNGTTSVGDFCPVIPDSNVKRVHNGAAVTSVAPLPPGVVLSGAKDGTMVLFDAYRRKTLHHWQAHEKEVTCVELLAPKTATPLGTGGATDACVNPIAISGSRDKTLKLWSFGRSEASRVMSGHALVVTSLTSNPEVTRVASGSRDNSVRLWDVETGNCVSKNQTSRNLVTDLKWSPDGKFILQTSEDKEVKLFDAQDLSVVRTFPRKTQIQTSVDVSADCRRVATSSNGFGGAGCEITLWDLTQGKVLCELRGHTETTNAVKFFALNGGSGDGKEYLASASNDCSLRVWDLESRETVGKLCLPGSGPLTSIGTLDDGTIVVSSFNSGIFIAKFDPNPDWSSQALALISNY